MAWLSRRYCQTAAVIFLLITVYTVVTKLAQERLADDFVHSVLHLCSGLVGIYAGWLAASPAPAQGFTSAIGGLYFALGCYGLVRPGLLLGTPFAIPLGVAENVFHFTRFRELPVQLAPFAEQPRQHIQLALVDQFPVHGRVLAGHPQRGRDQGKLTNHLERLGHHLVRRPAPDVEVGPVFEAIQPSLHQVESCRTPLADELGPLREERL
jgi:hypothetical protein